MAYVVDTTRTYATGVQSITGKLPSGLADGDAVFFFVGKDNAGGGTWSTPSGWTAVTGTGISNPTESSGTSSMCFYVENITAASLTAPSSGVAADAADEYFSVMVAYRDVPTSSVIDVARADATSSDQQTSTAVTTAANNELIQFFYCGDNSRQPMPQPGLMAQPVWEGSSLIDSGAAWTFEQTSGTAHTMTVNKEAADDGTIWTIAIKSLAGVIPGYGDPDNPPCTILSYLYQNTTGPFGGGVVNPSADISSIEGITFAYDAFGTAIARTPFYFNEGSLSQHTTANRVSGAVWTLAASTDLSGSKIVFHIAAQSGLYYTRLPDASDFGIFVGLRSGSSPYQYRFWHVAAKNSLPDPSGQICVVVDVDDTDYIVSTGDINTFDSTDVTGVFLASHCLDGSEQRIEYAVCAKLNTATLIGGSAGKPAKIEDFKAITRSAGIATVVDQGALSSKQFLCLQDLKIGNGSDAVHFVDSGVSLEYPEKRDEGARRLSYNVDADGVGITFQAASGDTIKLTDSAIGSQTQYTSTFNTGAGTVDFTGTIFGRANLTFSAVQSGQFAGSVFRNCAEVVGDTFGDVQIDASVGTQALSISGASQAALQTEINKLSSISLTNNAIALEIDFTDTSTGTTNITLTGPANLEFVGNTTDIKYTASKTSALTITPGAGSNSPTTTTTAGSATGVTIDSSTAITLSAPNLIDGTRYQIYNVTQDAELYNTTVSGGAGISINTTIGTGLAIEVGDTLRLRATYQSGTTYKVPIEASIIANASSNVWTNSQSTWTVMESYGLDGSDYDYTASGGTGPFTADFTNDEPDYELTSNFAGSWFVTWLGYILTTSNGIDQWYGGFNLIDAANIELVAAIIPGLFDNQTTSEVYQTDTIRIFRDDGVRPVRNPSTGGGGIDLNWKNQVYLQTTGSGALTSEQATQLANASTTGTANASALTTIDGIVDAILVDTGTTLPASISSLNTLSTLIKKVLVNRQVTDAASATMTIYDDDDTTPLYEADLADDASGSIPWDGTNAINYRDRFQ